MMNNTLLKQATIAFIILLTIVLIKPVLSLYSSSQEINLNCSANLSVIRNDSRLSIAIKYYINGDSGIINYQGILDDGKDIYDVSRTAYFTVSNFTKMVNIRTNEITVSPADDTPDSKIKNLLPAAYLLKDQNLKFEIYKQKNSSYLFSTGYIPSFYCSAV